MEKFTSFYFEGYSFDSESGKACFSYSFDEKEFFEETLYFYDTSYSANKGKGNTEKNIDTFLFPLFIALGISYYKLFPTEKLIVKNFFLDEEEAFFWKNFYKKGLGEFFYKNKISAQNLCNFEGNGIKKRKKIIIPLTGEKILLPIGGGKDSLVSQEILSREGCDFTPFVFGKMDNIKAEQCHLLGKKPLFIKRELGENLFKLIEKGYYNGHVPISGIISFASLFVAYLYDFRFIAFSNEASASAGNTFWEGLEINHQYSKSFEFEKDFNLYKDKYITSKIKYFSFLRPFYEIKIAELFSKYAKKYFLSFSSCNRNFTILKKKQAKKWCCACPKCVFVYSILRPFLDEEETKTIFGKELYNDENLETLFLEVFGFKNFKPFECVGEEEEARLAFYLFLQKNPSFSSPLIKKLKMEIKNFSKEYFRVLEKKYFSFEKQHFLPKKFEEILKKEI